MVDYLGRHSHFKLQKTVRMEYQCVIKMAIYHFYFLHLDSTLQLSVQRCVTLKNLSWSDLMTKKRSIFPLQNMIYISSFWRSYYKCENLAKLEYCGYDLFIYRFHIQMIYESELFITRKLIKGQKISKKLTSLVQEFK